MPDLTYLFTIRQIAEFFDVPAQPLYLAASRGKVPRYGRRGDYRYDLEDFYPLIQGLARRLADLDSA